MRTLSPLAIAITTVLAAATTSLGGTSDTAFTYQGFLRNGGVPDILTRTMRFGLWDAEAGGTELASITHNSVPVDNGVFHVELDFGATLLDGSPRWIEIMVDGITVSPRQPLTGAPMAIQTRGINVAPDKQVIIRNDRNEAVWIESTATDGVGLLAEAEGAAVYGITSGADPARVGVIGESLGGTGAGVEGRGGAVGVRGIGTAGVVGQTADSGTEAWGVYGYGSATTGYNYALRGETESEDGRGVYALARSTTGSPRAVFGQTNSPDGYAGYFQGGRNYFEGNIGVGELDPIWPIQAMGEDSTVIYGCNSATSGTTKVGVWGNTNSNSVGVLGTAEALTGQTYGVRGEVKSDTGTAVYGLATSLTGPAYGVVGRTNSANGNGVFGYASHTTGTNYGVWGLTDSTGGRGVDGIASAMSGITIGVRGRSSSPDGIGTMGHAAFTSGTPRAVYGLCAAPLGYAGYFEGGRNYFEGRVGIGVESPNYQLHVDTTLSGNITAIYGRNAQSSGNAYGIVGVCDSATGYDFFATGAGIDYGSSSSRRWKQNISAIPSALDKLGQLRGVYFDWDADHGGRHDIGMIAEEVGAVLPEIVQYEENGVDAIGMDYAKLTPLLVEAVKALKAENEQMRQNYESRLAELESLVRQLANDKMEISQR
ncbi:MAG: tail fiber domain-containing protein [Phycisphaerales bacterium]|nr:tail fiber domain-containing protein [Phycisphaerales bacterium]